MATATAITITAAAAAVTAATITSPTPHAVSAVIYCTFSPSGRYLISSSDFGERHIKLWYANMPYMKKKQTLGFR
jgi:hypothetical protein